MISQVASWTEKISAPIIKICTECAAVVLFALMSLTAVNVILRYVFHMPIFWAYEVTQLMIGVLVSLAFPIAAALNMNVKVTVVSDRLPERSQLNLNAITDCIALLMSALISWQAFVQAGVLTQMNQVTALLHFPKAPFLMVIGVGFGLTAIVLLKDFLRSLSAALERSSIRDKLWLLIGAILVFGICSFPLWGIELPVTKIMVGIIGLVFTLVLLFARITIGFGLALVAFAGLVYLRGLDPALGVMGRIPYSNVTNYMLSVMPLFILMGMFAMASGTVKDLYDTLYKWIGHLKGGLAQATVGACAMFGAVTGDMIAAAATMSKVALPEMRKHKYADSLATACVAAGGTLANLIPPSMGFIVYGLMTETSIGKLFIAGIVPGIFCTVLYMLIIYFQCSMNPNLGPPGEKTALREKLISLKGTGPIIIFFIFIIGGIYLGIFTPVEAGGMGAFGILIYAIIRRKLSLKSLNDSLVQSISTTAMIFLIFIGAIIFSYFLAASGVPLALEAFVKSLPVSPIIVIASICVLYMILGCFLESLSLMLFTIPVFFPIIVALGYDPVWYGVMMVLLSDLAVITPPVGMNVFVLSGVTGVPVFTIFRGVWPFVVADSFCIAMLVVFPQIATFLPDLMM